MPATFCRPRAVAVSRAESEAYRAAAVQREKERAQCLSQRGSSDCASSEDDTLANDGKLSSTSCSADLAIALSLPMCRSTSVTNHTLLHPQASTSQLTRRSLSLPRSPPGVLEAQAVSARKKQRCGTRLNKRDSVKDERRQLTEEKAAQLQEADRLAEERRCLANEKALLHQRANQHLEEERQLLVQERKRLEAERQSIAEEARLKLEEELRRMRAEAQSGMEEAKAQCSEKEEPVYRKVGQATQVRKVPSVLEQQKQELNKERLRLAREAQENEKRQQEQSQQALLLEQQRQAFAQERCRLMHEVEEEQKKQQLQAQLLLDRDRQEIQQERARLAQEAEEHCKCQEELAEQERLRVAEEAKREHNQLLENASRMVKDQQEKVKLEKLKLLEERRAFEEERSMFHKERRRLEDEYQRLKEAVKTEQQKLNEMDELRAAGEQSYREMEQKRGDGEQQLREMKHARDNDERKLKQIQQLRAVEEKLLQEARQKRQAFQTVAALATADHSSDVDPSLTDVRQRAMAKAAALSKKIGSVVFNQLLDQVVGKLDPTDARLFQDKLASGELLDVQSTSICTPDPERLGMRGGKPYFKPAGWIRCGLGNSDVLEHHCKDWCVAYHGTTDCNALRIMLHGLKRPGEPGVQVVHGQVHSDTGTSIYVSPSIEYAAFPCYSQIFKLGDEHWAQLILECRVRPGAFKEASGTLGGNKHWPHDVPIDHNFPRLDDLEWLLEQQDDIVVSALLIREFGDSADSSIYGDLVKKVQGPEYLWTELRADHARSSM